MPKLYRPETDNQRIQAMQASKSKYENTAEAQRAISSETYDRIVALLPIYQTEVQQRSSALFDQGLATETINPQRRKLRLYISHYFIGLDNAILREELPASSRATFGLDINGGPLPKLTTDANLVQWAENIVSGEATRAAAGLVPLSNPTAAQVESNLNLFLPMRAELSTRKSAYDSEQEDVAALRAEADDLLEDSWDETLFFYRKDEAPSLRRKAREWGVVYRPSKGETPTADDFSLTGRASEAASGNALPNVEAYIPQLDMYAMTDSEGNYYFGILPAGTYSVRFRKDGYMEELIQGITITDGTLTTLDVQMNPMMPPAPTPMP